MIKKIPVEFISPNASMPIKAKNGDLCFDVFTTEAKLIKYKHTEIFKTGLKIGFPSHVGCEIKARSGMGLKGFIVCCGEIDSGYRGELGVVIHNLSGFDKSYPAGSKIAQIYIKKVPASNWKAKIKNFLLSLLYLDAFVRVRSIDSNTDRGIGSFGSTGS